MEGLAVGAGALVVLRTLPAHASTHLQLRHGLQAVAGEQFEGVARDLGEQSFVIRVLDHGISVAGGNLPVRQDLARHFHLEAASFGAGLGDGIAGIVGVCHRQVVLAYLENAEASSQALVPEFALETQLVALTFLRLEIGPVKPLPVLGFEDGGVTGVGRPVFIEVVDKAKVGRDDAVFLLLGRPDDTCRQVAR